MVDFFLVPVSRLHLKSVRICWCGSSIFCGDGSDLIPVVRYSPSQSWCTAARTESAGPEGCQADLSC